MFILSGHCPFFFVKIFEFQSDWLQQIERYFVTNAYIQKVPQVFTAFFQTRIFIQATKRY